MLLTCSPSSKRPYFCLTRKNEKSLNSINWHRLFSPITLVTQPGPSQAAKTVEFTKPANLGFRNKYHTCDPMGLDWVLPIRTSTSKSVEDRVLIHKDFRAQESFPMVRPRRRLLALATALNGAAELSGRTLLSLFGQKVAWFIFFSDSAVALSAFEHLEFLQGSSELIDLGWISTVSWDICWSFRHDLIDGFKLIATWHLDWVSTSYPAM